MKVEVIGSLEELEVKTKERGFKVLLVDQDDLVDGEITVLKSIGRLIWLEKSANTELQILENIKKVLEHV